MLQPGNPLLEAVEFLPVSERVRLHSIIGTGRPMLTSGAADGVVPVSSAWHAGVDSELRVPTTHFWVHRDPDSAAEVARILRVHSSRPPDSLGFVKQKRCANGGVDGASARNFGKLPRSSAGPLASS